MARFEDLTAWKLAHQLLLATYRLTSGFPASERYGLTDQARRAAFSVAANLAEGSAKRGKREFLRFIDMSMGSLAELRYILLAARDLGLLSVTEWEAIEKLRDEVGRVVWGLYRSMGGTQRN